MNEIELKIRVIGDPVLRKKAKRINLVSSQHNDILSRMARIMYESKGIGLAAPQIGLNQSLVVVDIGNALYKLINPKIVSKVGQQVMEEGCLSVPGIYVKIKRAKKIRVETLDENGNPQIIDAQDLLACVFQHEIDHLEGKLIVDYASLFKKLIWKRKLRNIANGNLLQSENKRSKL